ncbi:hypothetical protein [Paraburkholderia phytofirmans]|uniref:hypothetical protein n=1 Tax=Paraburkholderia phytofirmans TaxID=261302 RepID=UPI0038BD62D5
MYVSSATTHTPISTSDDKDDQNLKLNDDDSPEGGDAVTQQQLSNGSPGAGRRSLTGGERQPNANRARPSPSPSTLGHLGITQPATTQPRAPVTGGPAISSVEAGHLVDGYENSTNHPDDSKNATALADLQGGGLRGMPQDAVQFDQQVTMLLQKIAALPQQARERYLGMAAAAIDAYEHATSASDRQKIASALTTCVREPVDAAYQQVMNDPAQRVKLEFTPPYGSQYLGAAGKQQVALLRLLGQQFEQAKTPAEREALFRQAAGIRQTMQQQIASAITRAHAQTDAQWAEADRELDLALKEASGLQGDDQETGRMSFARLQKFAEKAFTSPRNAQEFLYRMQHDPKHFQALNNWYKDAAQKSAWASAQLPYFARMTTPDYALRDGVKPPQPPQDFTNIHADDLPMGNFAGALLYRYQTAYMGIGENSTMYGAVRQGGPLEKAVVDAHMPPRPKWLQQAEDVIGRITVGLVPGVNLFTDYLVPADSLTPEEKLGIDLFTNVLGGIAGEAKIPGGRVGGKIGAGEIEGGKGGSEMHPGGEGEVGPGAGKTGESNGKPSGTDGGGGVDGLGHPAAGQASHAGPDGARGVPDVPDTYLSKPAGELTPDPQFRGIYRDSKGRGFIQQGDKTYAVAYDRDNGTWRVQSPEGGTKPSYAVRLNSDGNWEVNTDTGLKGGAPSKYTDELGRQVYTDYDTGLSYSEIAKKRGISESSAQKYYTKYADDHGLPKIEITSSEQKLGTTWGRPIYEQLEAGVPLQVLADKLTNGNISVAYRGAMRYATETGKPKQIIEQARARAAAGGAGRAADPTAPTEPAPQPTVEPMTRQQYDQILELYDEGHLSPQQIAQQTGVPESSVKDVEHGYGYWSPSKQAYVEPISDPENPEPPAKRQRVEPSASSPAAGPSSSPVAGPSGAGEAGGAATVPGWGRAEMRQFVSGDDQIANNMQPRVRDAILNWLDGNEPAPEGLQQEMIDDGFGQLTPDLVRRYFNGETLANSQMADIERWLGI